LSKHITRMQIDDAEHYTPEQRQAIIDAYPEHEREARTKGIPSLGLSTRKVKCRLSRTAIGLANLIGCHQQPLTISNASRVKCCLLRIGPIAEELSAVFDAAPSPPAAGKARLPVMRD
jgi:hypothetical protein